MADLAWFKGAQFFDDNGDPLNGGTINVYDSNSTSARTVFKDALAASPWTQPITLDAAGRLTDAIYIPTGNWKFILKTSGGSTVVTQDVIPGAITIPSASFAQPETPVIAKAVSYTIVVGDLGSKINADPTGGDIVFTLPSAVTAGNGATIWIEHVGTAGKITVVPTGVQTLDSGSSIVLLRPHSWLRITSDAANWTAEGADRPFATAAKVADYTVTTADGGKTVTVDASGAARTVTLPAAASAGDGFEVSVVKVDTSKNAVTLDGNASETINGALTLDLGAQWNGVRLRCDGTGWTIMRAPLFAATATTLAADTNDWAPTGLAYSDVIRAAASAAYNVTGMTALGGGARRTIENVGTSNITLLGNNTGSVAANRFLFPRPVAIRPAQSITLVYDATSTGWRSADHVSGMPVAGGFKNLKVQVTSNTAVAITADALTVEDANGESVRLLTVSVTPDSGTSGANGLDTGSAVNTTWYGAWVIYNPTTNTVAGLISTATAFGSLTLPSGYTFGARVGMVRTDGSAHFLRTLQYGRTAQYVIGTNPTVVPPIANGVAGTYSTTSPVMAAASVTGVVPTAVASRIWVAVSANWKNAGVSAVDVAPNTSYGGTNNGITGSAGQQYPYSTNLLTTSAISDGSVWLTLESTSIAWAAAAAGGAIGCLGWEDNL